MSLRSLLNWVAKCEPVPQDEEVVKAAIPHKVRKRSVMENRCKVHYRKWVRGTIKGEDLAVKIEYTGNLQPELLLDLLYRRR